MPLFLCRRVCLSLFCLSWLLVPHSAWSQTGRDAVLGLPAPQNPAQPGALVLHGGGTITGDVFEEFVARAGGAKARIVFVPCAGYSRGNYSSESDFLRAISSRYSSWVNLARGGRIADFRFLYTDDPQDANREAFVAALSQATGVWFSGGYQSRLNYRFVGHPEPTRFQLALAGVLARGGVVGGTSAGTAAIPEIMTLWQAQPQAGAPLQAVTAHGFGLMSRAIVEQHFDGPLGRLERFTSLLKDNDKLNRLTGRAGSGEQMIGFGVEERTALVVHGSRLAVRGDGRVHLFLKADGGKTVTWRELDPGESGELRLSPQGALFASDGRNRER